MSSASSEASPKAAARPRVTGAKNIDEAFDRIKAARQAAHAELAALRKEYKKDIGDPFASHMCLGMHDRLVVVWVSVSHRDRNA